MQALTADYNVIFFSSPQILSGRNKINTLVNKHSKRRFVGRHWVRVLLSSKRELKQSVVEVPILGLCDILEFHVAISQNITEICTKF